MKTTSLLSAAASLALHAALIAAAAPHFTGRLAEENPPAPVTIALLQPPAPVAPPSASEPAQTITAPSPPRKAKLTVKEKTKAPRKPQIPQAPATPPSLPAPKVEPAAPRVTAPTTPAAPPAPPAPSPPAPPALPPATSVSTASYAASNRKPPYPRLSRRNDEQGTVVLRVLVKADGSAGSVEVKTSSGYPLLDESARSTVQTWRFNPATVHGRPVDEWYQVAIPFTLQEN